MLGRLDSELVSVRRSLDGKEACVEGPGFLEIGAPARERNERVERKLIPARAQYVRKPLLGEERTAHLIGLRFGERRPANRQPRLFERFAERSDARCPL